MQGIGWLGNKPLNHKYIYIYIYIYELMSTLTKYSSTNLQLANHGSEHATTLVAASSDPWLQQLDLSNQAFASHPLWAARRPLIRHGRWPMVGQWLANMAGQWLANRWPMAGRMVGLFHGFLFWTLPGWAERTYMPRITCDALFRHCPPRALYLAFCRHCLPQALPSAGIALCRYSI